MLGGVAGAIRGIRPREGELSALVKDALNAGCYAVIVHASNEASRQEAEAVIDKTLAEETSHA